LPFVTPCWVVIEPGPPGPAGIVFIYGPATPVTFTLTKQSSAGVMVALLSAIIVVPATAVSVAPPQSVKTGKTGLAKTSPLGSMSVYAVLVRFVSTSLLLIRMVNWLKSPTKIVLGTNPLLNEGAETATTVNVALAGVVLVIETGVVPSIPLASRLFAEIVLINAPVVVDVTFTST
jgi:hypothetical protein